MKQKSGEVMDQFNGLGPFWSKNISTFFLKLAVTNVQKPQKIILLMGNSQEGKEKQAMEKDPGSSNRSSPCCM